MTINYLKKLTSNLATAGFSDLEIKGIVAKFNRLSEVSSLENAFDKTMHAYGFEATASTMLEVNNLPKSEFQKRFEQQAQNANPISSDYESRRRSYSERFNKNLSVLELETDSMSPEQVKRINESRDRLKVSVKQPIKVESFSCQAVATTNGHFKGMPLAIEIVI